MIEDQVFCLRIRGQEAWKAVVNGKVVAAEFVSKGAAQAAISVERRRREAKGKRA